MSIMLNELEISGHFSHRGEQIVAQGSSGGSSLAQIFSQRFMWTTFLTCNPKL